MCVQKISFASDCIKKDIKPLWPASNLCIASDKFYNPYCSICQQTLKSFNQNPLSSDLKSQTLTLALSIFSWPAQSPACRCTLPREPSILHLRYSTALEGPIPLWRLSHRLRRRWPERWPRHRGRLGEDSEVGNGGGALFKENPGRDEGHAGAQVLEGQVETSFGKRTEAPYFGVDDSGLQQWEALVRGYGVHLGQKTIENLRHICPLTECKDNLSMVCEPLSL